VLGKCLAENTVINPIHYFYSSIIVVEKPYTLLEPRGMPTSCIHVKKWIALWHCSLTYGPTFY